MDDKTSKPMHGIWKTGSEKSVVSESWIRGNERNVKVSKDMKVLVIIPAYNEEKSIRRVVNHLIQVCPQYDYVIDAVDNVTAKLLIIQGCYEAGTPVISCMGTGNKLDPSRFKISDIYKTSVCPLARVMRRELKKRGIEKCRVLWSDEEPVKQPDGVRVPGSLSFGPGSAGLRIAG